MLNIFTRIADWFAKAAEPDVEDDFDPEYLGNWQDEYPRLYEPERVELYENIGGRRYA